MAKHQQASTGEITDDGVIAENPLVGAKGEPLMQVKVHSPYQVYFDEKASSISAENGTGPFDILPHHHNFISLLNPCELVIQAPFGERRIRISGGMMHVRSDIVIVFLDV